MIAHCIFYGNKYPYSNVVYLQREFKKYGMYSYKINLQEDTGIGNYASGNSFFELLATFSGVENLQADKYDILDKINSTFHNFINSNDFHSDAYHYLSWTDDPNDLDFEKWAKLLVKDLYKYDIVSPFRYYRFKWENVGVMPFYFRGQNIETVRFDTLDNVIDFLNGTIAIEKMTVNSTLGFLEVSGKQDTDFNFEYRISVPWKMVTKATASKLFKRKQEKPQDIESEIQYAKKNTKYVTVKLVGDSIDYSVSLARRKK